MRDKIGYLVSIMALCMALSPVPSVSETIRSSAQERTEFWEGKVLTASFRAGMCFSRDGKARGVLILRHANGQEDPYHLYGTIRNNEFDLSHSSGHHFAGKLVDAGKMEGRIRLGNGMKWSVKGSRKVDVPLKGPDCAPMH